MGKERVKESFFLCVCVLVIPFVAHNPCTWSVSEREFRESSQREREIPVCELAGWQNTVPGASSSEGNVNHVQLPLCNEKRRASLVASCEASNVKRLGGLLCQ